MLMESMQEKRTGVLGSWSIGDLAPKMQKGYTEPGQALGPSRPLPWMWKLSPLPGLPSPGHSAGLMSLWPETSHHAQHCSRGPRS